MGAAEIAVFIAGASFALTVIVLLVRGSYLLGKLINQVDNQEALIDNLDIKVDKFDAKFDALEAKFDAKFDALEAKFDAKFDAQEAKFDARFDALIAVITDLHAELQQTNRILVGLANHTHDADGRTVFTIPS